MSYDTTKLSDEAQAVLKKVDGISHPRDIASSLDFSVGQTKSALHELEEGNYVELKIRPLSAPKVEKTWDFIRWELGEKLEQ